MPGQNFKMKRRLFEAVILALIQTDFNFFQNAVFSGYNKKIK